MVVHAEVELSIGICLAYRFHLDVFSGLHLSSSIEIVEDYS